jgi:NADPH:quinone reductase-like Zn-dependent oxidoreductase
VKTTSYDGSPGVREFERLNRALAAARLKVPIAKTYRLSRAAAAYKLVEKGHVLGKVVLRIRSMTGMD